MGTLLLIVTRGRSRGAHVVLADREVVIGREGGCDLRIAEPRCSRRHARIYPSSTGFRLEDLSSTNGTVLNGVPLGSGTPIGARDRVRIGDTELEVQAAEDDIPDGAAAQA